MNAEVRNGGAWRRALLATAVGFAVGSWIGSAAAQETAQPVVINPLRVEAWRLGDYKVEQSSSPKQTAPLLDTPQTITIIPEAVYEEQRATDLTDVLKNTPGISFNAGENGFGTTTNNFSIRGFDSAGSIYVDGSRDSGSYTRDIFNVEQVEVAKGAAGDNGRGGIGGYVNLVTKTPVLDEFFTGGTTLGFDDYGTELQKRLSFDGNYAFDDNIAVRLNAFGEDSGVPGRDIAENDGWGVAPSIALGLSGDLRATLAFEHVELDDLPDWGVPGATIKGLDTFDPSTKGADRDNFYGLDSDYDDVVTNSVLALLEYDINEWATISNQTRWADVDRDARYTLPTGYVPATQMVTTQTQFYDRVNTSISNMTNLLLEFDTGSLGHTLSTGVEVMREESDADRFGTSNPGNTGVFDPDDDRGPGVNLAPIEHNDVTIDTVALYAYDTVEISEQFALSGGLRGEYYTVDIGSHDAAGMPTGSVDGFDDTEYTLGGRIGAVYKPVEEGSLYASFGVTHVPPGSYLSNPDISRSGDNAFPGFVPGAKPVYALNYEIGVKWEFFDRNLLATAALFRTEKHNVPITGRDEGETVDSLKGYGEQIVQGLEVSAAGNITEEWSVFGGFALIDSERQHSAYLDEVRRRANPGDYGTYNSTDGDQLAFTPRFTANLWMTYELPFDLTVGGGVQHVSSSFLGRPDDALRIIPNGQFGKLPAYTIFNAMASYEITENVDIAFNVENIFNEKYAVSTNWPGTRATLGGSRTYLISTGFRF